ncbi:DUF4073 domain-containing protein, partial [Brevibacillus sp. SYP-B805]|uniref:DUF4073 domain-containing protein n=1 Tax=Brevibacillus sp. SYP-B805 TaxID=1578199 RepID=UPI0013EC20B9|nr:DUF4073 domain-containing protein [Brevibacillus sp. SYP-B805]
MYRRNNNVKKVITVLLSTSVILSMTSQAMASTSTLKNSTGIYSVSNVSSQESVQVESITARNGSIIVKLSGTPSKDPVARDFKFTKKVNNKSAQSLSVSNYVWSKSNNTAYFTFTPIAASKEEQTVEISVKYNGSQKSADSFTIAEKGASVEDITIVNNSPDTELTVGSKDDATLILVAVLTDGEGDVVTGKKVTWTSSNKKIATVDSTGRVKAVGAGTAIITAKVDNISATFEVKVLPAPPTLQTVAATNGEIKVVLSGAPATPPVLNDFSFTAEINNKTQMVEVTHFAWDQDKKTAIIHFEEFPPTNRDQYVTITVTYKGSTKKAKSYKISKINSKVETVQIVNHAADAELTIGSANDSTLSLVAVAKDKNGKPVQGSYVKWKSSNDKVATVDQSGKVTAVGAGKATITVTIDGKTASLQVTVKPAAVEPSLTLGTLSLSESSANDGSITGSQVITLVNGKFASDISASDVTVNNLPAGLGISLVRNSDTQITISFTGKAANHSASDSKNNLSVKIAKSKVVGASNDVVSGTFGIVFADPVVVIPPGGGAPSTLPVQSSITTSGTYDGGQSTFNGNVVIAGSGTTVTLQNVTVDGDITIRNGGTVNLVNVTARNSHKIIVQDVASNSLHLNGVQAGELEITDGNGARVVAEGTVTIPTLTIAPASNTGTIALVQNGTGSFSGSTVVLKPNTHGATINLGGVALSKLVIGNSNVTNVQGMDRNTIVESAPGVQTNGITFTTPDNQTFVPIITPQQPADLQSAIQAVNNAANAAATKQALETYAATLNLAIGTGSDYARLTNKDAVAAAVLNNKPQGGYASAADIKTAFDNAVAAQRQVEDNAAALQEAQQAVTALFADYSTKAALAANVDQAAINAAKAKVDALNDSVTEKASLLADIQTAQDLLDAQVALEAAQQAVAALFADYSTKAALAANVDQAAINAAKAKVDALNDSVAEKASLLADVQAAQDLLDSQALQAAKQAVEALFVDYSTKAALAANVDQTAINAAKAKVDALNDSVTEKASLLADIQTAQDLLDAQVALEAAQQAVAALFADYSTKAALAANVDQAAINAAKAKVDALNDSVTEKAGLLADIQAAQDLLDAQVALEAARQAVAALFTDETKTALAQGVTETEIAAAEAKVNALPDGQDKDALVQDIATARELLAAANNVPTVEAPIADQNATVGGGDVTVDASGVFADADGDTLTLSVTSDDENVATVAVNGTEIVISPVSAGTATITVTADDGKGGTVQDAFTVTVAPAAQQPAAPNVTADDENNVLVGADATMEYSTDGGQTWVAYDEQNVPTF